jgi:hypothetical protein
VNPYWFKLLVRAIGLLLIGLGAPWLLHLVLRLGYSLFMEEFPVNAASVLGELVVIIAYGAQVAFGLYLLSGGGRLTRWCLRDTLGSCAVCGYDTSTITVSACPECGAPIPGREKGDPAS